MTDSPGKEPEKTPEQSAGEHPDNESATKPDSRTGARPGARAGQKSRPGPEQKPRQRSGQRSGFRPGQKSGSRDGSGGARERRSDSIEKPKGPEYIEQTVHVNRVAKVVKGGRRFSFNAIVAVGDGMGKVGIGLGKANEITDAIRKAGEAAKRSMVRIPLHGGTIPFEVKGKYGAGYVILKPASPGTGVIAGGPVRAVMESAGIRDILAKSLGSNNPHNMIKAAMKGLEQLESAKEVARRRGISISKLFGIEGGSHGKETKTDAGEEPDRK